MIEVCKLADGKLSCRLNMVEFFIMPNKGKVEMEGLEEAFEKLLKQCTEW